MALSDEDVREILRIIDESDLEELSIQTDDFSLHVSKSAGEGAPSAPPQRPRVRAEGGPPPAPPRTPPKEDGLVAVPSPMLGTFYRAESPGADPFVDVGSSVDADTTVCIIEVMKMMNSVPAGVSGIIEEVCPDNGELVEYGETLFRVRPR